MAGAEQQRCGQGKGRAGPGTLIPGLGVEAAHEEQWGMPGSLGLSLRFSGGESLIISRISQILSYMRSKESIETGPWLQIQDGGSSHLAKLCW